MAKTKMVLAYSGGLDTSAIIPWLIDNYDAEVICFCADLGDAPDEKEIEEKAYKLGAKHFTFKDYKDKFVQDFVYPLARAGAIYQEDYLLGTAIARPLIGEGLAEAVQEHGATHVVHGATGKGNDQVRFERAIAYLLPETEILAPWKVWDMKGRTDLQKYLAAKGHDVSLVEKTYSVDENLLHRSCEGGILEDITQPYPEEEVLTPASVARDASEKITLEFIDGYLYSINSHQYSPYESLNFLNELGRKYAIGTVDLVEERTNGIKSRGIYETPGGTILFDAIKQLKSICFDRKLLSISKLNALQYAELVYDGLWHSQARRSLDGFFNEASLVLTGTIEYEVSYKQLKLRQRKSQYSLYDQQLVSFDEDEFDLHHASHGFCRTLCLTSVQQGKQAKKLK